MSRMLKGCFSFWFSTMESEDKLRSRQESGAIVRKPPIQEKEVHTTRHRIEMLYNNIIQLLYKKCDPDSNDEKTAEVFSDFLHDLRIGAHRGYSENEIATLEQTVIKPILEMLEKSFKDYEDELNLCPKLVAKYPHGIRPKAVKLPMPTIINTQNNPQFMQIVSPNEIIILICSETKIGDEEGFINICLPRPFVENVLIASGLLFGNQCQIPSTLTPFICEIMS